MRGFFRIACPAARIAFGEPARFASSAYVIVLPNGMARHASQHFLVKGGPSGNTASNVVVKLPLKYRSSCSNNLFEGSRSETCLPNSQNSVLFKYPIEIQPISVSKIICVL